MAKNFPTPMVTLKITFSLKYHFWYTIRNYRTICTQWCVAKNFPTPMVTLKSTIMYNCTNFFIIKVNEWKWIISETFGMLLTRSLYLLTKMCSSWTFFPNRANDPAWLSKIKLLVFYANVFSKVSFLKYFHTFYSFLAHDHL